MRLLWGRRVGKSFSVSVIAAYLAAYKDWRQYLLPGEVGTIMIVAKDRMQARTIFRHVRSLLKVPGLRPLLGEARPGADMANADAVDDPSVTQAYIDRETERDWCERRRCWRMASRLVQNTHRACRD